MCILLHWHILSLHMLWLQVGVYGYQNESSTNWSLFSQKTKQKQKKQKKISKTIFNTLHHLHFLKYKTLFLFLFDTIRHDSEKINYVRIICLCRLSMHPLCPIRYDEISPGRHVYLQLSSVTVLMDCLYKESFGKVLSNTPPINISAFPIKQKKNLKTPLET